MAENKNTEKEPLFSKKNIGLIKDPLMDSNPVTVQVLGICSALAITAELKPSIIMALSVMFVLAAGNVVISVMRNNIPSAIRIIAQLVVVAALVILVDLTLKAYVPDLAKKLSVFILYSFIIFPFHIFFSKEVKKNEIPWPKTGATHY